MPTATEASTRSISSRSWAACFPEAASAKSADQAPRQAKHVRDVRRAGNRSACGNDAERPCGFKVYRHKQGEERTAPLQWRPLRKGVADLARRAELSQVANQRYLEAPAAIDVDTPLKQLTDKLCRPVWRGERRHRGLRPFEPDEARLLEIISRGEHQIAGFRNRDVRTALYGPCEDADTRRRRSAAVTRRFAMLRAHGLIKKFPRRRRYLLTQRGGAATEELSDWCCSA